MYFVYILRNKINTQHYKGMTNDLDRRIIEHNQGKHKSTSPYRPWEIAYFEEYDTFEEARARELFFKSGSGRELIKSILENS
jgi:putative endonuclease